MNPLATDADPPLTPVGAGVHLSALPLGLIEDFNSNIFAGVGIDQRVVDTVAVAVQALRTGIRQDGIRLDEPAELGVVVPGIIIIQPDLFVKDLSGEAVRDIFIGGKRIGLIPERGIDIIMKDITLIAAVTVGDHGRRAQVVVVVKLIIIPHH